MNKLYNMSINSIYSNYHGFPTDCPHREKNGWTGDAQLSLETCLYNFDMAEAYRKWLNDFIDNQRLSGQISAIIPTCGWGFNWGSGPAWDIALFRISYAMKKYYNDNAICKKMYPVMKKYFDYISSYVKNGLLAMGLGDWNYPKDIKFKICPTELTDSCYYMLMAEILTEFSEIFEHEKTDYYNKISKNIKNSIKEKYSNKEESLTGMCALQYFRISNESQRILKYIEDNNYEPHAGILGVKFLLDVLGKIGRTDIALQILERTEYPSFGYWIKNGQTSLCEDFELTNSLNHHMYGYVSEFMMRYICGIEFENGMQKVVLSPNLPKKLDFASSEIDTQFGVLKIPPNVNAILKLKSRNVILNTGIYVFEE
jgi:alpha-L-rhamnosidase